MLGYENWREIIYYEIRKIIIFFALMIGFSIIVSWCLIKYEDITNMINNILIIITVTSAIIIINITLLMPKRVRIIISIFYVGIVVFSSLELLSKEKLIPTLMGINNVGVQRFSCILFFISLMMVYINMDLALNKKVSTIAKSFVIIFIINQSIFQSILVTKIITIILFLISYRLLNKFDLIKDRKINISKFVIIVFILISMFSFNDVYPYIYEIFTIIITSTTIVFVDNIVNCPYRILFKDLYNNSVEMMKLNEEIIKKNKELEFSQNIVMQKERGLKNFFRNVPIPLVILNKKNQRISFVNSSFINATGNKPLKKVINRTIFSLVDIDENIFNNVEDKEDEFIFRGSIDSNGELKYFDIELIKSAIGADEVILIFNDITSKIKVDFMKESIQNKMLEENLKKDFLSSISHDLKTPINVIYSAIQLEECFIKNNNIEGLKKYNIISKQNCLALIRLANNLIDTSRIESGYLSANLKVKNIVYVLENIVITLVDYAKSKDVDLIFDTNEEEVFVELDEDFMQRIMVNLISNAIKFCNVDGVIKIVVQDCEDKVIVSVEDNGAGMDEKFVKEAFNRYSMGKNNESNPNKGTGIGLFVVKSLMELQNGYITVNSKVGEGTRFELVFNKISEGVKNYDKRG